jgi:hypothetical protein
MPDPDLIFSPQQFNNLKDRQFLLSKIEIGKKIEALFGKIEVSLHAIIPEHTWPTGVLVRSGKLSKGENYRGLPYYMLDYPRKFEKDNVFAFRTMFWWGNHFSATLHVSGDHLQQNRSGLISSVDEMQASEAYICINDTPWEYHFNQENYLPADRFTSQQLEMLFATKPFVKVSYRWELGAYLDLPQLVTQSFRQSTSWMFAGSK